MEYFLMHDEGRRLHSLAGVLKGNRVPQETINMILAARCGLPMQKIDPKSPIFAWVDEPEAGEPEAAEPATDAAPEKLNPCRVALDIAATLGTMELIEGLNILSMAANSFAGPHGYVARINLNENVEMAGQVV